MNPDGPVVVIGATGIDVKGRAAEPLRLGTSVTGVVRSSLGGVARNVAENLARLEVPTVLLSAVGQDHDGDYLLDHTAAAGVDTTRVLRLPDAHTGSYVSLLDQDGQRVYAIAEYDILSAISPSYLQSHRRLIADASMLAIDANLSPRALGAIFRLAKRYGADVRRIEAAWGEVFTAQQIDQVLQARPAKLVAIVHAETSTGALQPLDEIAEVVHRHGALLLVDADGEHQIGHGHKLALARRLVAEIARRLPAVGAAR